jgi:beta-glucanase (GH16 family)
MINGDGQTHATYHWRRTDVGGCGDKDAKGNPSRHPSLGATTQDKHDASEWHEYAVEYSHDHISFAFDGEIINHITNTSVASDHPVPANQKAEFFDVPYFMILNTAVGGPWPGEPDATTVFPTYHLIDYVRVSQPGKA